MRLRLVFLIILALPAITFGQELPEFKVKVWEINASPMRVEKMNQASSIFERVMNDKDFQTELLKKKFYFHGTEDPNRKLTTRQIVKKLYDAKESFETQVDNEADIYWTVQIRRKPSKPPRTLGSGYPSKKQIYTRSWFVDEASIRSLAGHIAHEWTHKFYFVDTEYNGRERKRMVSYAFGELVRKHAKKYL